MTTDTDNRFPVSQDITHQSLSLGRVVDRLPPGEYELRLIKGNSNSYWRVIAWDDTGITQFDLSLDRPMR